MNYHQNARLTIHSRELLAKRVLEQGLTLKLAAASFNVTAKTAAKWVRRYREAGATGPRVRADAHALLLLLYKKGFWLFGGCATTADGSLRALA